MTKEKEKMEEPLLNIRRQNDPDELCDGRSTQAICRGQGTRSMEALYSHLAHNGMDWGTPAQCSMSLQASDRILVSYRVLVLYSME